MRALAEAAAARESAEYERVIAEREHARREREAEIERKHQRERAEYEKDLAILAANRKVAVANGTPTFGRQLPEKTAAKPQRITKGSLGRTGETLQQPGSNNKRLTRAHA